MMRLLCVLLVCLPCIVFGQTKYKPQDSYKPVLPSNNAYDYYISALLSLKGSLPYEIDQPPNETALDYLEANKLALELFDKGVALSYSVPFSVLKEAKYAGWHDNNSGGYRDLARLLALRIRWDFATEDGMDAIKHMSEALKFAYDISTITLNNYLLAISLTRIIIYPMEENYNMFSAKECRILIDSLSEQDSENYYISQAFTNEKDRVINYINAMLENQVNMTPEEIASELSDVWYIDEDSFESSKKKADFIKELSTSEGMATYRKNMSGLIRQLNYEYNSLFAKIGEPYISVIEDIEDKEPETYVEIMHYLFSPKYYYKGGVANVFYISQTRKRLLACELAIRKYRLKIGKYPLNLNDVLTGTMSMDPYTGKPLIYRNTGSIYTLYSVGTNGIDDGCTGDDVYNDTRKQN